MLQLLVKAATPDALIHIGDLADCWQISDFDKNPEHKASLQDDLDESAALLRRFRELAPTADCWFLEGNHEDRLRRLLWRMNEKQKQLLSLRNFQQGISWPRLLELKGWNFVPTQGQAKTTILPKLIVKHGTVVSKWSAQTAKKEWERYGRSGLSGHTHRLGVFYTNDFNGAHVWAETGCTCKLDPEYVMDPNWQQGCVIVTYCGDRFALEPVYIQDGRAVWRGKEYRA